MQVVSNKLRLMRYEDGSWPNVAALSYALIAYVLGWWLLLGQAVIGFLIGVFLLAHGMVIAAYLLHECAHNTIFMNNQWNAWFGRSLMWLTGACYGAYEDIRYKHFRHHVDRSDITSFDYRRLLQSHPWLLKIVRGLEWCYIPAVEILMHIMVIVLPFVSPRRRHMRRHVIVVLVIRAILFGYITTVVPLAILGYVIAYLIFMTVLRFMDAFQHTYEIVEEQKGDAAVDKPDRNSDYEYKHTYSNYISLRYPWLNLLTLNFAYHNAHHVKPTAPWYRLPSINRKCLNGDPSQVITFHEQLQMFHRMRLQRIMSHELTVPDSRMKRGYAFVGVDGVSFLTTH